MKTSIYTHMHMQYLYSHELLPKPFCTALRYPCFYKTLFPQS